MVASVAKDNVVQLWRHTSDILEEELDAEARIYQKVTTCKPHKQPIRCLLWKKYWAESDPISYSVFSSAEVHLCQLRRVGSV